MIQSSKLNRYATSGKIKQISLRGPSNAVWDKLVEVLPKWDEYRRTDWITYLEYPEFTNKEVDRLLERVH